jgi:PAS domain S-box-containing protein
MKIMKKSSTLESRSKTEISLQESEHKFHEIVKYLDEGYYSVTMDGLILDHNQAFNRILGFDINQDLKGVQLPEFWQNPDERKVYLDKLITTGIIRNYLINAKTINGEKIVVLANSHLVKDEQSRLVRIEGTYNDFTERKRTEKALEDERNLLRTLIDLLPTLIFVKDRESRFLAANVACAHFMGVTSPQELIGKSDAEFYQAEVAADFRSDELGVFEGIPVVDKEEGSSSLNGTPLNLLTTKLPLRDSEGNIIGLVGASFDITERKLAEEELKISKERLLFATEGANLGIWNWNIVTDELIWSDQCKALFGVPPDETMSYQRFSDALHPDDRERTDKAVNDALDNRNDFDIEYRSLWPDESIHWLAAKGRGYYDATGKAVRLEGVVMDITERKKAEEKLITIVSRQEAILSSVPDIIMEVNNDKVYVWANQSGLDFFGDDVIGKEASFYFEGEQDTYKIVQPLFKGNDDIIYLESWQRHKNGEKRLLSWWCRVLKDENGNVTGALSTARDITDSRQLALQIEEERNRLSSLLSSIPDEVWFTDTNKKFTLANTKVIQEFGLDRVENLDVEEFAQSLKVILPDGTPRPVEEAPPLRALKGEVILNLEEIVLDPNSKELRYRQVNSAPVKDAFGNIIGAISVVRDITELKRLNEELEQRVIQRTEQLEIANKELEAFTYSVSHDLRAPLRAVDGFSKFVLEDYENKLDAEGKRLLNLIRSNTQKMDHLITDLLALSRVTRCELNFSGIDMTQMAISMFKETAAPDVPDKISFKVDQLPEAYADPTYMRQVWANLIANAIKFSSKEKKPIIEICGHTEDGFNVYYIKDNGVGFNPEYVHKLFGVFQRLHKSDDFEGTGVGLAIVQRIINRHGGKVWAEGEEGKGAAFYFSLPVKKSG